MSSRAASLHGCRSALPRPQNTAASSASTAAVARKTACQVARSGPDPASRRPTAGGMMTPVECQGVNYISRNTISENIMIVDSTPGSVATMLVTAISVPARLGARSAWLEKTPQNMLP